MAVEPYSDTMPVDLNPAATEERLRAAENDPFSVVDDGFAQPYAASEPMDLAALAAEHPEFAPQPPQPRPENGQPVRAVASAPPQPEVIEYQDGSSITVEKTNKGWQATLDTGTGAGAEVFYGRTKDEMWQNIASGKLAATKKIRELNRKAKLGNAPAQPARPIEQVAAPVSHQLNADELFDIKTKLASDPNLALETWFQKRTGLTVDQLMSLATQGATARQELDVEAVAKEFVAGQPDYYSLDDNYAAMVAYLSKTKLNQPLSDPPSPQQLEQALRGLYFSGNWSVVNLNEAFEELSEAGLLETAPVEEVETQPAAPAPPNPDPNSRIENVRVGKRLAGAGIRQQDSTVRAVEEPSNTAVSAEALDNLSDKEVAETFAAIRRSRIAAQRTQAPRP